MDVEIRHVYVTAPDPDIARAIAFDVVVKGLAACGKILPGMESVYSGRVTLP